MTRVSVVNRAGDSITSLAAWEKFGGPAADRHWVEGRSAYELALDWIEGDAPARLINLLGLRTALAGARLDVAIAEKKTSFDALPRGPRNHDLLVRAENAEGRIVVGVEGKADESFDEPLWRWREKALARSAKSAAPDRLDRLTTAFFGSTIDEDVDQPPLGSMGYQLLSALAGTLADAQTDSAESAVLLLHEFKTSKTDDEKHARNGRMLDDFIFRLARGPVDRSGSDDEWITPAIAVAGDGTILPASTPVFIAKMVTDRRSSNDSEPGLPHEPERHTPPDHARSRRKATRVPPLPLLKPTALLELQVRGVF